MAKTRIASGHRCAVVAAATGEMRNPTAASNDSWMAAAADRTGRADRSPARTSATGPTGCATSKKCSTIRELRAEAARIRDRAEDAREEFKRHAKEPDWTKLQDLVAEPLVELSRRIDEEIRRLESPDALVPIDRDPVPPEFAEQVRRYYERLGSGE